LNHVFNISNYNTPLPDLIYLDTSFIYEVYGDNPDNKHADDCYNFTNRLVANDKIMVVSHLTYEELEHVITKGIYTKYGNRMSKRWDILKKETDRYMPEVMTEIERVTNVLMNNPNIIDLDVKMDMEFLKTRQGVIKKCSLLSRDASHVVAAHQFSINSIATVDYDFHAVPGFNIFTPNDKYFNLNRPSNSLMPVPKKLITEED
jgi:predicted nucleic acid-binding protein